MQLYLSDQAYTSIVAETHAHIDTETGGIFLGRFEPGAWYIIEVIDPGYQSILRQVAYFEYDETYVTHLANVRARLYKVNLELLGLWHRHPGGFDRFSATDDQTHSAYLRQNPQRGIISSLVNIDPRFRLTHYFIDSSVTHHKITDVHIGDKHIPEKFLQLKFSSTDTLLTRTNKEAERSSRSIVNETANNGSSARARPANSPARDILQTINRPDYLTTFFSLPPWWPTNSKAKKPTQSEKNKRADIGSPLQARSYSSVDADNARTGNRAGDSRAPGPANPPVSAPRQEDKHPEMRSMPVNEQGEIIRSDSASEATDTALETLLTLLENELEFLETQHQYDYNYDYDKDAKAINLILDYAGNAYDAHYFPEQIKFSIVMRGRNPYCQIEGSEKSYQKNFVRSHIEAILDKNIG